MNPFTRLFRQYRPLVILTGSAFCAIIATSLIWSRFSDRVRTLEAQSASHEERTVHLLVASRRIAPGDMIQEADATPVAYPEAMAPQGYFTAPADIAGLYARWPIAAGEPFNDSKVLTTNQGGLAVLIPESMRAVTIGVDRITGLERFLIPGSRVDVLVVFEDDEGEGSQVETLLQGVAVIAVAERFDLTAEEREDEDTFRNGGTNQASTVTLAVEPDEAARLVLAVNNGHIQLAMRNYSDSAQLAVASVYRADIMTDSGDAFDAHGDVGALAFEHGQPQHVVEVYKGSAKTETTFHYE